MGKKEQGGFTLAAAEKMIASYVRRTEGEDVPLEASLFRAPVQSIRAVKAQPGYDQASRDGFVVSKEGAGQLQAGCSLGVEGEIQAGTTDPPHLRAGTACRIMTGALIPAGGIRVIPQEDCEVREGRLSVSGAVLERRNPFIRRQGSEIDRGRVVAHAGSSILPDHLVLLAATGHSRILVHRRPRVAYFCTGSELVGRPDQERQGLKVSGNRYLLDGLIRMSGGIPGFLGTVADTEAELARAFSRIDAEVPDFIISTGGMGPGKYDLLEEAFVRAGGRVLYRSLLVRPGKATLFGLLGRILFFGLPGPPPAAGALFSQLIGPTLLLAQGMRRPPGCRTHLDAPVVFKEKGVLRLLGGVLKKDSVRLAEKAEAASCHILFPAHRLNFKKGDAVRVSPLPFPRCYPLGLE